MIKIHPKQRFSKNNLSLSISDDLLKDALTQLGLNPQSQVTLLTGGFMNANFLVQDSEKKLLARFYSTDMNTAQREHDVLQFLEHTPILTPKPLIIKKVQDRPVLLMEYLEGMTLEDRLLSGETVEADFFEELGRQLNLIHKIEFPKSGFIHQGMRIGDEYQDFGVFLRAYIEKVLKMLEDKPEKLAFETNQRFRQLIDRHWNELLAERPYRQLVHCDFNPKNIMVTREGPCRLVGIIDWEFCLSGDGIMDLGNFFRFEDDYPAYAKAAFLKGYESAPSNWQDIAKIVDLGSMCSFLERPEDYQESFRTARAVIDSTLEWVNFSKPAL